MHLPSWYSSRCGTAWCQRPASCFGAVRCPSSTLQTCCQQCRVHQQIEHLADIPVMVNHRVVIGRLPAPCLTAALFLRMREQVHVCGIEPDEKKACLLCSAA